MLPKRKSQHHDIKVTLSIICKIWFEMWRCQRFCWPKLFRHVASEPKVRSPSAWATAILMLLPLPSLHRIPDPHPRPPLWDTNRCSWSRWKPGGALDACGRPSCWTITWPWRSSQSRYYTHPAPFRTNRKLFLAALITTVPPHAIFDAFE